MNFEFLAKKKMLPLWQGPSLSVVCTTSPIHRILRARRSLGFVFLLPQVAYLYTKVRSEFGKHCSFKDVPAFLLETVPCSTEYDDNYVARNPSVAELDTSPHMSGKRNIKTSVNMSRYMCTGCMSDGRTRPNHVGGGGLYTSATRERVML